MNISRFPFLHLKCDRSTVSHPVYLPLNAQAGRSPPAATIDSPNLPKALLMWANRKLSITDHL
ncbi:MAG: hypothetical protein V7K24_15910 [Nostoc sp.]